MFIGVEIVKDPLTREPDGTLAKTIVSRLFNNACIQQMKSFETCPFSIRAMMEYNILIMEDGLSHNVIKVKPPLCFTQENADSLLKAFDEILSDIDK